MSLKREGIKVIFHRYENPKYQQLTQKFQNNMSIVDLIFNEGPKSLEILTGRFNK